MRAAVLRKAPGRFEIEELRLADLTPSEVRVRVVGSGLCHTDRHVLTGDLTWELPLVGGHEVAGVVEDVGDLVSYVRAGDHVIACLSVFCGHCVECLSGRANLCVSSDTRRRAGDAPRVATSDGEAVTPFAEIGGFAEEILVHENALVKIDPEFPLDTVCIVGCATVTGMGAVFNTAQVRPGSSVVVVGVGGVGLHAVQAAYIAGARQVVAVDLSLGKLQRARSMGATDVVDARSTDAVEAVKELTGGGADFTFEAIGLTDTAEQAIQMLRPHGLATLIGVMPEGSTIRLDGRALRQERRVSSSLMGSTRFRLDIPLYLEYYRQGRLNLDEMISNRISLADVNEGYAEMESGDIARNVIVFN